MRERFPTLQVLEEVSIKPLDKTLYLDFYIPLRKLCIEVHGQQHYTFVPHFHSTRQKFLTCRANDRHKSEWCELNNIAFITLKFDEIKTWSEQF